MSMTQPGRNNQNQESMPSSDGPGQACVWLVSCFLFLLLLTGGVFLALYISLPPSTEHAWFLPAGMGLVAAPWVFWILTCLYRCIVVRIKHSMGQDGSPPQQQVTRQPTAVARAAPLPPVVEEDPENNGGDVEMGKNGGSSNTSRESEQPLAHSMS